MATVMASADITTSVVTTVDAASTTTTDTTTTDTTTTNTTTTNTTTVTTSTTTTDTVATVLADDIIEALCQYLDHPENRSMMAENANAWSTVDLDIKNTPEDEGGLVQVWVNVGYGFNDRARKLAPHIYSLMSRRSMSDDERDIYKSYEIPWYAFAGTADKANAWAQGLRWQLQEHLGVTVRLDWDYCHGMQWIMYYISARASEPFYDERGFSTFYDADSEHWQTRRNCHYPDCISMTQVEDEEDEDDEEEDGSGEKEDEDEEESESAEEGKSEGDEEGESDDTE